MARFQTGVAPTQGSGSDLYLRPNEKGTTVVMLVGTDGIKSSQKMRNCFKKSGAPCDASWMEVPNDPSNVLGDKIKRNQTTVLIPVAVMEGKGKDATWSVKVWQTTKTIHSQLISLADVGWVVKGMQLRISKNAQNRWEISAAPVRPFKEDSEEFQKMLAEIPSEEDFDKMFGPVDAEGVKAKLIKACGVSDWNGVLAAFGVAVPDSDDEDL